jgi:hypothetical protein
MRRIDGGEPVEVTLTPTQRMERKRLGSLGKALLSQEPVNKWEILQNPGLLAGGAENRDLASRERGVVTTLRHWWQRTPA